MSMTLSRHSFQRAYRGGALGFALALATFVTGCSSQGDGSWGPMFSVLRQSWERRDGNISLEEASAVPYATLGVRIGGDSEQLIVLATDSSGERLWTSAARIALTTRGGRIIASAGFPRNLSGYSSATDLHGDWYNARQVIWTADFADLGLYSVKIVCDDVPAGADPISILGKEFNTFRVDETCRSDQLDWSFTNNFWVSRASNRVWRSVQHIHPKMDVLQIELLRPPTSQD